MSTFYPQNDYRNYLCHYGVKGMKWKSHRYVDPKDQYQTKNGQRADIRTIGKRFDRTRRVNGGLLPGPIRDQLDRVASTYSKNNAWEDNGRTSRPATIKPRSHHRTDGRPRHAPYNPNGIDGLRRTVHGKKNLISNSTADQNLVNQKGPNTEAQERRRRQHALGKIRKRH